MYHSHWCECIACIGRLFRTLYGDCITVGDRPNKEPNNQGYTVHVQWTPVAVADIKMASIELRWRVLA